MQTILSNIKFITKGLNVRLMKIFGMALIAGSMLLLSSCKKFLEVEAPGNQVIGEKVFEDDATAIAAIAAIYAKMNYSPGFASGSVSITFLMSLYADDLVLNNTTDGTSLRTYNNNILTTDLCPTVYWGDCYYLIYSANAILNGLQNSNKITPDVKTQLQGEALFIRAFCHFYLLNLFGEVPYITTTDYRENSSVSRTSMNVIYDGIVADLAEARNLLKDTYISTERVRPNKWAATAFLSRVYLFAGDWVKSETTASEIINSPLYKLTKPDSVFLKNSNEAIWQLMPSEPPSNTNNSQDGNLLIPSGNGMPNYSLPNELLNAFEVNDLRRTNWINSMVDNSITYYYPYKYKQRVSTSSSMEYSMVLRLGEQYLVRAEARAKQNKISDAVSDLNTIRQRAGLGNLSASLTQTQCIAAIEQERRVELFTEWGHRWFDLKRTGRSDAVLAPVKPGWNATDTLLPIPDSEILINSNLTQNAGY